MEVPNYETIIQIIVAYSYKEKSTGEPIFLKAVIIVQQNDIITLVKTIIQIYKISLFSIDSTV